MRTSKWLWWVGGVIVLALVAALMVARGRAPESSLAPAGSASAAYAPAGPGSGGAPGRRPQQVPVVGVGHPKQVDLAVTLSLTASIASLHAASIVSKIAGYVDTVMVRPGDMVKAGQVVAVVEHAQLDSQVAQAQAAVMAAQTGVQTAQAALSAAHAQVLNALASQRRSEADLGNAQAALAKARAQQVQVQANYTRVTALYRDGLIAAQAVDNAKADVDSAQAAIDAANAQVRVGEAAIQQAQAQVRAAQAQEAAAASQVRTQQAQVTSLEAALQMVRLNRDSATIRAPFAGVVVSRNLDPGAYVSPGGAATILIIADLDQVAALVNVAEAQMGGIRPGRKAEISVDAYPNRTFTGTVSRVAGGVDTDTRTVLVEIGIANPGHPLRPGMYARVVLAAGSQPALVVPLSALTIIGGQQFAWVLTDGTVSRRPVTVGRATGQMVEITQGLRSEDTIVVRGTEMVRDRGPVRAVPVGE
jgi:HlyD family secretion protein